MNLSELKQLKYISEPLPAYCHQQAEKQLDSALQLIDASQTGVRTDSGKLLQACAALMDAMRYHKHDIRPCLALAYAFSLLDEEDMALACLSTALRLDPQNPLVVSLLNNLRPSPTESVFVSRQIMLSPAETLELYDRVEKHIITRVMRLAQHPYYQLEPAVSGERARILLRAILEVRSMTKEIYLRMQPLEQHATIQLLRQQMQPLEAQLTRLEQKYCLCGEYRLIQKEMEVTLNACRRLEADFSRQLASGTLAPEIDVLLNNCDHFADRLDAMKDAEDQASELILLYQCLSEQVSDLQDRYTRYLNHNQVARSA